MIRVMSEPRDDRPRDPQSGPIEISRELTGDQELGDQQAFVREGEVAEDVPTTDTELYQARPPEAEPEHIETLTEMELRSGETDDPDLAAEEGLTYVPPVDPPVVPSDDPQGAEVAAGFGATGIDEPIDVYHPSATLADEDEMAARVRDALRADAATSSYADSVAIGTRGRTVALRGMVDDVEDTDNMVEVVSRVAGIDNVIDELEVRALEER